MLLPLQNPASYRVEIGLYRLNLNTGEGVELSSLASNVENSGRRNVTIPTIFDNLSGGRMQTDAYPVVIRVTVASTAPEFLSKRQTDATLQLLQQLTGRAEPIVPKNLPIILFQILLFKHIWPIILSLSLL